MDEADPGNAPPEAWLGPPADDSEMISRLAGLTTLETEAAAALDRAEGIQ